MWATAGVLALVPSPAVLASSQAVARDQVTDVMFSWLTVWATPQAAVRPVLCRTTLFIASIAPVAGITSIAVPSDFAAFSVFALIAAFLCAVLTVVAVFAIFITQVAPVAGKTGVAVPVDVVAIAAFASITARLCAVLPVVALGTIFFTSIAPVARITGEAAPIDFVAYSASALIVAWLYAALSVVARLAIFITLIAPVAGITVVAVSVGVVTFTVFASAAAPLYTVVPVEALWAIFFTEIPPVSRLASFDFSLVTNRRCGLRCQTAIVADVVAAVEFAENLHIAQEIIRGGRFRVRHCYKGGVKFPVRQNDEDGIVVGRAAPLVDDRGDIVCHHANVKILHGVAGVDSWAIKK